jgi:hypothetical protein
LKLIRVHAHKKEITVPTFIKSCIPCPKAKERGYYEGG